MQHLVAVMFWLYPWSQGKRKLLALDNTHLEHWVKSWITQWMENESLKLFRRFRYSPWVVVDYVVFRGSCHNLHDLDRDISQIALMLNVWFPVTKIIDILRFHLLEFYFNWSNSTSKVYKMSTEDLEFLKYKSHCILVGLILNIYIFVK